MRRRWTEEEDIKLRKAVQIYKERNWQQVANYLENRTGQQCLHRWQKALKPSIRRGKWTKEEDEKLREAVKAHGVGNWMLVQVYSLLLERKYM